MNPFLTIFVTGRALEAAPDFRYESTGGLSEVAKLMPELPEPELVPLLFVTIMIS